MLRILFPELLVLVRKPRLVPRLRKQEELRGVAAPGVITRFVELVMFPQEPWKPPGNPLLQK